MISRKFGRTGVNVPVIGQGTWMLERGGTREEAVASLTLGIDLGMTHIDTAEMYGNGKVEEIVADAIASRRDQIFLVSKVLPSNASYEGTIAACKRSLRRLRSRWLDLYLLHWPSSYPIKETMRAMEKLADDELIRYIGVSNFDLDELKEAEEALSKHRIACNQVLYHPGARGVELRLLPYCSKKGIAIVGYSPFGHAGFQALDKAGREILAKIAQRHGRTPQQVVLNYITRNPATFAIPKARHADHVRENSGSVGWDLTSGDVAEIERAFPLPDADSPLEMI
jgi:diketogulonate reductase-like aldo/keto reductase